MIILLYFIFLFNSDIEYITYLKYCDSSLTKQNVKQAIYELEIQYPEIVYAQAIWESGHFKSSICLKGNNLFGMKYPRRRHTLAIGTYKGHARYRTWIESIIDYKIWQGKKMIKGDYIKYLRKRGYNHNKKYGNKFR